MNCLYAGQVNRCLVTMMVVTLFSGIVANTVQGALVRPLESSAKEKLTLVKRQPSFRVTFLKPRPHRALECNSKANTAAPWKQSLFLGPTDFSTSNEENALQSSSKDAGFHSYSCKRFMPPLHSLRETRRSIAELSFTCLIRVFLRAAMGQPITYLLRWFISLFPFWVSSTYYYSHCKAFCCSSVAVYSSYPFLYFTHYQST
jgi:hypothetical protein